MKEILKRLRQYVNGLITEQEFHTYMDQIQVRGAIIKPNHYIAYDYNNQFWIDLTI